MTAHENSRSRPGGAESPFFSLTFSEEMTCCGSKNDFYKKLGGLFLALKCKTNHVPAKSVGTCAKFKKYLQSLRNKMRADMCIPRVSTIYVGCFS
jgi:hypothetical protein